MSAGDDKKLKGDEESMKPLKEYIPLDHDVTNSLTSHEIINGAESGNEHDVEIFEHDPRVDEIFNRAGIDDADGPGAAQPTNNNEFPRGLQPFDIRSEYGAIGSAESIPDVNIYQHKKTVAQGMMDLALFSANANQLRYVVESKDHPYFYPGIVLITISLLFQVFVGVGLLLNTRYNVKDKKEICIANKINNFTVVGIFLVTVINVFISAFGVAAGGAPTVALLPRSGGEDGTE